MIRAGGWDKISGDGEGLRIIKIVRLSVDFDLVGHKHSLNERV